MDLKLNICHINTARKPEAASTLIQNYSKCNNLIVSINEPPSRKGTVIGFSNFKNIIGKTKSDERIDAITCINGQNLNACQLNQFTNNYCSASEISFSSLKFIFVSIYMSPSSDIEHSIAHLNSILKAYNKPIIICTDSNARNSDWLDTDTNQRGIKLNDFVLLNNLIVANEDDTPTFKHFGNGGTSLIDLIIVNSQMFRYIESCKVNSRKSSTSDHKYIDTVIAINNAADLQYTTSTRKYNTKGTDWSAFTSHLIAQFSTLNPLINSKQQTDNLLKKMYKLIHHVCRHHFKLINIKKPLGNQWFDQECKTSKKKLNKLFRKLIKCRTEYDKQQYEVEYRSQRIAYKKLIRDKKFNSFKSYLDCLNDQNVFQSLKLVRANHKTPIKTILKEDGNYTEDLNQTIQHLFRVHFPNNNSQIRRNHHPNTLNETERSEIIPTNRFELCHYIKSMNSKKSPGPDAITSEILKNSFTAFEPLLTTLFNSLLNIGYFPNIWKIGIACFIPKPSSNLNTAKAFRPITLLNVMSKLLEKVINERLVRYLFENGKMSDRQYGFVRQRSTVNAIDNLLNHVNTNKLNNKYTILVALDVTSAFDSVPWKLIIKALVNRNVPRYLINMISSYLHHRFIKTTDKSVAKRELTQGCPQGSCLGPLLFNILLDDLLKSTLLVDNFYQAFADDQIIAFSSKRLSKTFILKCERTIRSLFKEGKRLSLNFNPSKTQILVINAKHRKAPNLIKMRIDNKMIKSTEAIRYLGLTIDNKLTFKQHIKNKINRATVNLNFLKRISAINYGLSPVLSRLIYTSVIEPGLTYCSSAFAHRVNFATYAAKLRSIQRKCCLTINKSFPTARTTTSIWLSGLLPIDQKILLNKTINDIKLSTPFYCEKDRHWLSKTPAYYFRPIDVVQQVPPTADFEIYTDGSINLDGVGCAFIIVNYDNFEEAIDMIRLSDNSSVYQAELMAISMSINELSRSNLNGKSIYILTDSLSSIYSINNCNRQYLLSSQIRNKINNLQDKFNCKFHLSWIPSHSGIYFNELVDQLAKLSTGREEVDIELKSSLSSTIRKIEANAFDNWNTSLRDQVSEWSAHFLTIKDVNKLADKYTSQFITGHGLFNSYRKMVGLTDDSSCCMCFEAIDSPEHSLFDCPAFDFIRRRTLAPLQIEKTSDLYKLNEKNWCLFSDYCREFHDIKKSELFG